MIRRVKRSLLAILRRYALVLCAFGSIPASARGRHPALVVAAVTLLAASLFAAGGCGPFADPMAAEAGGREECGSTAYAKLVAGYAIALNHACGPTPIKDCAEILKGPVVAEHEPKFDRWAEECE